MLLMTLMASQVYIPESAILASVMVRLARPLTLLTCTRFPLGMFPHSNLQTIIGVGVPTASQMIEILPPISTFMLGGGAMLIDGAAVFKTVHEHT